MKNIDNLDKIREKVNAFLNPLGYSAKVEKSIGAVLYIIEPSTKKVGNKRSDFFDGMQILAMENGTFEVSEYMAGENENELYIYKETNSLTNALKDLIKGNKRKPIKKYKDGGGVGFRNIDKIKSNIGETVFNHINSLNKSQLEKQLSELKSELKLENKNTQRHNKLKDEEWYILYRLERSSEFKYAKGSTVKGVVGKLVGSYETKEKAEKMKKVFENAVSTEKGESFYVKKIQNPKSKLKYDLFKTVDAKSSTVKGGAMTKKLGLGGRVTNINDSIATSDLKDELRSKMKKGDDVIHFAFTDYGGDFMDKVAIEYFEENYPKNTLSETTAYYGKNAFVFGKPATEWIEASEDYPLGFEDFEGYYYEKQNEQENEDFERFLDDLKRDGYEVSDEAIGWLNENKGGYYSMTTQGLDFSYSDLEDELKEEGLITKDEMAEGGATKGFNYSIGGL